MIQVQVAVLKHDMHTDWASSHSPESKRRLADGSRVERCNVGDRTVKPVMDRLGLRSTFADGQFMNLILGLLTGLLAGWVTFGMLTPEPTLGRRTALVIGAFSAGIAAEFKPIFDASGTGGALSMLGIVFACAIAGGCIFALNMAARRYGHE